MIHLFHVDKVYPGPVVALKDVSLHVPRGEFVFLTGPSGAGKSTLLRLLYGAERPSRGEVLVADFNISHLSSGSIPYLRRNIGVVFQDFKLIGTRSVSDNVSLALEVLGMGRREVRRRVETILKRVGLERCSQFLPSSLSGGEQQRVAIARALVNDPALLLADEPTGNLDEGITLEIMELLCQAHDRGTTVLVATHDQSLLERYRRRVLKLDQGRLTEVSPVQSKRKRLRRSHGMERMR